MFIKKSMNTVLKSAVIALICISTLLCASGCNKIITSNTPPTQISNCNYNDELCYFYNNQENGTQFYTIENGYSKSLQSYTFENTITHSDLNYKISFSYTKIDGSLIAEDFNSGNNNAYYLKQLSENNKGIFICLNTVKTNFYPYLFNASTNTIDNIFENTGVEDLWIEDFTINQSFKKAIFFCKSPDKIYLCDTTNKSLSDMTILTGINKISNAILTNDNNVILFESDESGKLNVWFYDTGNGECKLVSDKYTLYDEERGVGLMVFENQYALNVLDNGKIQAVDLAKNTAKTIKKIRFDTSSRIDEKAHLNGKFILISSGDGSDNTVISLVNLAEGRIVKQRNIPSDLTNTAYYNTSYAIAYSDEGTYNMYHLGNK